ncbi:molybdopterin-dependent oxidoreductase [Subtercola frigoramans]|uniref:DMSO/TMAO reductase YedYZ molybdopterin-dependent catalytic subunit n=1 Tax=Subtercola frigoramans TaxID=120298 RepID=A0ABS2L900_9MICO|nr:molybdopterin-dependent oxidoreductase [Subtercola frigoramans]MBM7473557.1 DMSO/TMAO reductase YedYZ molybdopterin-dependent catalytic subunit [Subtercola frigoramans]
MRRRLWAALTGVAAAAAVLATAEAVAVVVGPGGSPLFAVGSLVIDFAPPGVKELMISLFGTGDKAALLVILALVILAGAILAGLLEDRRPPWGIVVLAVFSAIAVVAITTRSGASAFYAIPTVIGMIVGVVILRTLQQRLARWASRLASAARVRGAANTVVAGTSGASESSGTAGPDASGSSIAPSTALGAARVVPVAALERRQFLMFLGVTAVASAVVGFGARMMNAGAAAVTAARSALVLPAAAVAAPAVPTGAELGITGLSPVITPAANFYRIDTALQIPQLDPDAWRLRVVGMVENEVEISFADLLALPLVENATTLTCVSNEVGGDLIGTAMWLGYPIRDLLARAKPTAGADMVLSRSSDGFTAGTPLEVLQDASRQSLLAVGMNGSPLPVEHGFPVRMVVPGLYGYVSATKWVVELKVTTFAQDMGYWTPRGWSALGPIKTASRIDTPRSNAGLAAGTIPIAGVAWAQHTGVAKVEVQIDNGSWQEATLADAISADTWRQWVLQWNATAGDHVISVRATDSSGYTQTSDQAPPAPDGSSGYHTIRVTIQ